MRIFALSDIHVDYAANANWVNALSQVEYLNDVLILAGDISDLIERVQRCVGQLVRRFKKVLFVPGNHELWVFRDGRDADSLEKFRRTRDLVKSIGASMAPYHDGKVSVVPLLAWYDFSFGIPEVKLRQSWMDFYACRWPSSWSLVDVTSHFLQMNTYQRQDADEIVVSFSHFLPRIDVISKIVSEKHRYLFPILGTTRLEQQVRQLRSTVHIYGHSHLNRGIEIEGTLYINNAFGYPHETNIAGRRLRCVYECH